MPQNSAAKEEIVEFIKSGEPGQTTNIKLDKLKRAAQDLFTANGLNCPIAFMEIAGKTILINREKLENGTTT